MSVEFWTGGKFRHPHERIAQDEIIKTFREQFHDSDDFIVLVFNVFCNGEEFDLLILKRDALVVADLKDCDKPIEANENGPWCIQGGGNLEGEPFRQIRDYRYSFMDFLRKHKGRFLRPQKAALQDFGHLTKKGLWP